MKSTKKLIISFVISLCIVLVIQFVSSNFFSKSQETVYMLVNDVYKGEKITEEDIKLINVTSGDGLKDCINVDYVDKVAKYNLISGKILTKNDVQSLEDVDVTEEKYEYISIEVKDVSDAVAYQLNKGENINVYFTARDISGTENTQSVVESTKTIKVLENKKIIGLYDISGNEVQKGDVYNAIILRVSTDEAMTLSNIKDEGSFNISLVK